ncbi:MAG: glycosyltransferase [Chloroflexi bacterium]|nr:MAG: glycosyltransferase [Chloroflexota bacterium]
MARSVLGQRDDAVRLAIEAAGSGPDRTAVRIAAVALALGFPTTAAAALEGRTLSRGRDWAMAAEIAFRTGRFSDAKAALDAAAAAGYEHELVRRLRARLASERRILEPGWRPRLDPRAERLDAVRGRVLHLLTNSLPDTQAGYTLRSQQVARSQRAAGLDPHMATRAGYPGDLGRRAQPEEDVDGIPYHRMLPDLVAGPLPDRTLARNAEAAADLVESLRPAAIQPASNHRNAQVALALRDRFGLPVVYEVRGFLEETWLSHQGDGGASSERYLLSRQAETGCMLAAQLGFEGGDVVVGYVSTLNAYEGVRHLIEAVALLRDRRGPGRRAGRVRALVVGDGPERPPLEELARSLAMTGRDPIAIFTGRVPYAEIARYYSVIDVFVVPRTASRVAQLVTPLKPYEAMAMERALVVSDVDALREIVEEGATGVAFRAGDSGHLADVLEPLVDDPGRRAELGRAARAWVLENRTWEANGRRYRQIFEALGAA